jgi:hypothetical protein
MLRSGCRHLQQSVSETHNSKRFVGKRIPRNRPHPSCSPGLSPGLNELPGPTLCAERRCDAGSAGSSGICYVCEVPDSLPGDLPPLQRYYLLQLMTVTVAYTVITLLSPMSRGKCRHWLPDLGFLTVVKAILLDRSSQQL